MEIVNPLEGLRIEEVEGTRACPSHLRRFSEAEPCHPRCTIGVMAVENVYHVQELPHWKFLVGYWVLKSVCSF